jgi:hypothetical protein
MTPRSGWARRLPLPVEVLGGRMRKRLDTLDDVRNLVADLAPSVRESRPWRRVTDVLTDAAEGRRQTSDVELAVRDALRGREPRWP